jgi:tryptophanyl-tRNA synthetase
MTTNTLTRRLSLLRPTGHLTLGNYLGALRGMVAEQQQATCFFGVADLHAMTVPHDASRLGGLTLEMQVAMLACGLDPEHATLFLQSQVPAHTSLSYLLECTAYTGELSRMIAFKEKGRGRPQTRVSLYTYPILMAADILLYRPSEVPVGNDQRQHVELTRDLAIRFNRTYGAVFSIPEITTPTSGARVMDLQDPRRKMSKSDTVGNGVIYLLDEPDAVARKVARAVTDSDTGPDAVRYDPLDKPGVSNLLDIIAGCTGLAPAEAATRASTYGQLKKQATDAVLSVLEPIRKRYVDLRDDQAYVHEVFAAGAHTCREETAPVLAAARAAIGLVS